MVWTEYPSAGLFGITPEYHVWLAGQSKPQMQKWVMNSRPFDDSYASWNIPKGDMSFRNRVSSNGPDRHDRDQLDAASSCKAIFNT